MLGWPRGSPFSSREKMTWYPRICPCCFPCSGGFQVTRMAVEFMASTSSFLGGAPGTGNQKTGVGRECRQSASKAERVRRTVKEDTARKESIYAEQVIFLSLLCYCDEKQKTIKIMSFYRLQCALEQNDTRIGNESKSSLSPDNCVPKTPSAGQHVILQCL